MRTRLIALCVLFAAAAAGPSMALFMPAQVPSLHAQHNLPNHACCPMTVPVPVTPAPRPDHRCCFLRGPVSSLPISTASGKRGPETTLPLATCDDACAVALGHIASFVEAAFIPPHSLQMNVILRN